MTKYIITGGKKLNGQVQLSGAKNAGFKALIATLLGDSPSTICGLGLISEVGFAKEVIASIGGKVTQLSNPHCLIIDPTNLSYQGVNSFNFCFFNNNFIFSIISIGLKFGINVEKVPKWDGNGDPLLHGRVPVRSGLDKKANKKFFVYADGSWEYAE